MKRFLLLPALLAMFQLQAQQIEEYRYWINDDPAGVTVTGIGPNMQVNLVGSLVLPALTKDFNTITIQFKDTNDVYSVPVSRIFSRNTGAVTAYEYWIDDAIGNRVTEPLTPGTTVNLSRNIPLCLTAGTHLFTIRFQGATGTWSVPITRQFTSTASPDTDADGLCDALDPCPLLANVVPGQSCNDNNACTVNDVVGSNCLCAGSISDADNDGTCDANDGCPNDPNKIAPGACGCAVPDTDSDSDGLADCNDNCPNYPGQIGSSCDDGDANTSGDIVTGACTCAGSAIPCPDDGNACTLEIVVSGVCTHQPLPDADADGTCDLNDGCPNDPNKIAAGICGCGAADTDADNDGTADCNDDCPSDPNKTAPGTCGCGIADTDSDGDLIPDCNDNCPNTPGVIGSACDDGHVNTTNDVIDANCVCAGNPIGSCTQNEVTLSLTTDNNGNQTSWDIIPALGGTVLCNGTGYSSNSTITASCCLPSGCYKLRVFDSFGDGLNSGPTGGWVLRNANNERLIDNANDGIWTGPVAQHTNEFCLPIGTDHLTATTGDQETVTSNFVLQITANPAVTAQYGVTSSTSGYQFWIFDAEGTYSRRVAFMHSAPGASAPAGTPTALRSTYLKLSTLTTSPVPSFKLLNVRVRARVAGVYAEFGPACRLKIDPTAQCQTTQVTTTANPVISCGSTITLPGGTIWADAVPGANYYQFEFTRPGYLRNAPSATRNLLLGSWLTKPLQPCTQYTVRVRASFDGGLTWCPFGPSCSFTTGGSNCAPLAELRDLTESNDVTFTIWPNPNAGERFTLNISDLGQEFNTVSLDIVDLFGKQVIKRTIPVNGSTLNTVIDLHGDLATGVYLVSLTAGEHTYMKRLVIQ